MELTENEKKLINFLRDTNEPPANLLLRFIIGVEVLRDKIKEIDPYQASIEERRISQATDCMRSMD